MLSGVVVLELELLVTAFELLDTELELEPGAELAKLESELALESLLLPPHAESKLASISVSAKRKGRFIAVFSKSEGAASL